MSENISGDLSLEDDSGNIVETMGIGIQEIQRLIYENIAQDELRKTFCLQFIDPWGDTIFNRVQLGVLKNEFEVLLDKCKTSEEKEKLQSIIEFIAKGEKLYTFVRFYGD